MKDRTWRGSLFQVGALALLMGGCIGGDAFAQSTNCVEPFNDPRYNNRTEVEVTTQRFACEIIRMAKQPASHIDDFNNMCRLIANTFDLRAVSASLNSDLGGAFTLNDAQTRALLAAYTLNKMEFLAEQRSLRNQLDFIWVTNGGSRLESSRRGWNTRFLLRNAPGADQTILYFNPQGKIVNLSSSGVPFGATLVGALPDEIKNSNGGMGINANVVPDLLQRWLGARVAGCGN